MPKASFSKIFHLHLAVLAGTFCFLPNLISLTIAILGLLVIVGYVKRQFEFKFYWPLALLALFYVAYLIGTIYTTNQDLASRYLENKLSFVIFPLLFSFRPKFELKLNLPIKGLAIGLVITVILGLYHSSQIYDPMYVGNLQRFTATYFSYIHHPTYFGIYLFFATATIWFLYRRREKGFNLKWIIPFFVISISAFFLCMSLSLMLSLFVILAILALRFVYKKFNRIVFFGALILVPIIVYNALFLIPGIKEDVIETKIALSNYLNDPISFVKEKSGEYSGNETRMIMWTATFLEIKEHPLGVGTGNVDLQLSKRLQSLNQAEFARMDDKRTIAYNPHNQFLQTTMEIGWIGLGILISFLLVTFWIGYKKREPILLILVFTLGINSLFESILQRQSGIVFFSFWICFLIVFIFPKNRGISVDMTKK